MAIYGGRFIALPRATFTFCRISSLQGSCEYQMTNQFFFENAGKWTETMFSSYRIRDDCNDIYRLTADFLILT